MSNNKSKELNILLESISAKARTGLAYSSDPYDLRRYQEILATLKQIADLLFDDSYFLDDLKTHFKDWQNSVGDKEYVTPKVAVAIAVFNDSGEVLLVKRNEGLWALPGGYADVGLDPIQNAEKEVREETGLIVKVEALIGIFDSNISEFPLVGRQTYTLAFYAKLLGGTLNADPVETKGASFFNSGSLPQMPPVIQKQIRRAFRVFNGEVLTVSIDHKTYSELGSFSSSQGNDEKVS